MASPRLSRELTAVFGAPGHRPDFPPKFRAQFFGLSYISGAVVAAIWLALPHPAGVHVWVLVADLVVAALVGGAMLATRDRMLADWWYHLLLAVGPVAIAVSYYAAGPRANGWVLLFAWNTPYAFAFFRLRAALVQAVWGSVCALVIIAVHLHQQHEPVRYAAGVWFILLGTVLVVGFLVRALVSALAEAHVALAGRAEAAAALADFGRRTLRAESLEVVYDDAAETAATVLGAPVGSLRIHDAERGETHSVATYGWRGDDLAGRVAVSEATVAGWVLLHNEPATAADLLADPRFCATPWMEADDIRAVACVPITVSGRRFGVLGVADREVRAFSDGEILVLQTLASMVAAAVLRADTERRLAHQAMHDPLTGLPNRALLLDRLTQAVGRAGNTAALLLLDVDAFKLVNDIHGHDRGDALLVEIAPRLVGSVPPHATVARLGGDEFVVLLGDTDSDLQAIEVARRIAAAVALPLMGAGTPTVLTGSVGVALARGRTDCARDLLREADTAMYRAKRAGRGRVELFDEVLAARVAARVELEQSLRRAITEERLSVVYQPVVSLALGAPVGVETLVRWTEPGIGQVSPAEFIPVAEECGLITELGSFVIRRAVHDAIAWQRSTHLALRVSVNVSPAQLNDRRLIQDVRAAFAAGLRPNTLLLEITETALLHDTAAALAALQQLRGEGAVIVLDDFGTGYSSLSHVKRFPIDVVKIDREFVDGVASDPSDRAIVRAVLSMACTLGLFAVAEGVETREQLAALRDLGCEYGQGFLWSPGLPAADAARYMQHAVRRRRTGF